MRSIRFLALFLAIVVVSLLFDHLMSVDRLEYQISRISLAPGASVPGSTTVLEKSHIVLESGDAAELLKIEVHQTSFPGSAYLEAIISSGSATVWRDGKREEFGPEGRHCHEVSKGFRCRVYIERNESAGAHIVVVTPVEGPVVLRDLNAVSIAQHQILTPTNVSVVVLIFIFAGAGLLMGFVSDQAIRRTVFVAMSLGFVGFLSLGLLLFLCLFLLFSYALLKHLVSATRRIGIYILALLVSVLLCKLVWPGAGALFDIPINLILLPIGFSYLIARQIDLALKITTNQTALPTFFHFMTYNLFWPSFAAGPITQITEVRFDIRDYLTWPERAVGLPRMGVGLLKKVSADLIFTQFVVHQYANIMVYGNFTPEDLLLFVFGNMLFVYLDFSGYTDMVLGAARLMGVRLPENFNNPLMQPNMRAFWQHWHMSLTRWVSRTVFLPLSLELRRDHRHLAYAVPVLATTMTIGLWHGFQVTWILWAIHHALGIFLTDFFLWCRKRISAINEVAGRNAAGLGNRVGFLFVWSWLMLSYCFTLSSNPWISLQHYLALLRSPFDLLISWFT